MNKSVVVCKLSRDIRVEKYVGVLTEAAGIDVDWRKS